jgi:hypothetical protein
MDGRTIMKILVALKYVAFAIITVLTVSGTFSKTEKVSRDLGGVDLLPAWLFAIL